jgi:hypothetical protein
MRNYEFLLFGVYHRISPFAFTNGEMKHCAYMQFQVSADSGLALWYLEASSLEVAATVLNIFFSHLILYRQ